MNEVIKPKVIIVTGGSRGIGKGIVQHLAMLGHTVILNYNTSKESAIETSNQLNECGKNVVPFKADITKRSEVKQLVNFTLEKFGKIDVLINNAGISQTKLFTDITDEEWNTILQTNLTANFYTIQEVLDNMIHNKQGCIINISSIWGNIGGSCEVAYSATKAGLNGLTKALAKELRTFKYPCKLHCTGDNTHNYEFEFN